MKKSLITVCHRLHERGLVANHDGNISLKQSDGTLLATPTSFAKLDVTEGDILTLDSAGKVIDGPHQVFSEIAWHLAIYRVRPDVKCVVHAHPPTASGFGLARKEIGTPGIPEAIVSLGRRILTTEFFSPLDPVINQPGGFFDSELSRVFAESDACIVPGNGVWAVGQDPLQTYLRVELLEQVANQHLVAEQLGGMVRLDENLVLELLKKRPKPQAVGIIQKMAPILVVSTSEAVNRDELREIVKAEILSLFKN